MTSKTKVITVSFTENLAVIGTTLVRILTGYLIFRYGLELFQIDALLEFLENANIPFPNLAGYAAKTIELVGGVCLILGLFTRWVTPPLIIVMCGVIYTAFNGNIFEGEAPFLFSLLFTLFFVNGAGKWSLDHLIETRLKPKKTMV